MNMRTTKRKILPLNVNKQELLKKLCQAYAKEKNHWLDVMRSWKWQAQLGTPRKIRDEFVKKKYQSKYGLQARHWKLAQQDAAETWDKYWKTIFVQVRSKILHCKSMTDLERRYAYFLLKGYPQFSELMQGKYPRPNFDIEINSLHRTADYVRRNVKKFKKKDPSVKRTRIVKFDPNCYTTFEHCGRQYLKLMSFEKGKRIIIPLLGKQKIEGNLTVVFNKNDYEIHLSQELKEGRCLKTGQVEAVDFGYNEVMTDTEGKRYGTQLGNILGKQVQQRHDKMQKRHCIHAHEKKLRKGNSAKAARIRKNNLGYKKLNSFTTKARASCEREINTAINKIVKEKKPSLLITENLRHLFTYNKSKKMNRKLSYWVRGKIQNRIAFKALTKCFRHEQVNPAYGSQVCPYCDFVDQRNRNGDKFKCLHCKHEDESDRIAALNYERRYGDPEIGLYMPYSQVKTILLDRFHRRLETGQPVTVPGRTLETVTKAYPQLLSRK